MQNERDKATEKMNNSMKTSRLFLIFYSFFKKIALMETV